MLKYRELVRMVESHGVDRVAQYLSEGLLEGHIPVADISLRELAAATVLGPDGKPVGIGWVDSLGPQKSGGYTFLESAAAGISLSGFSNITGTFIYNALMPSYNSESLQASQLVGSRQTNFNGEKLPGVEGFVDDAADYVVAENMPFPEIGFGDDYIESPATQKRGRIISITKETIFFDRTGLVVNQARRLGEFMGRIKDKLIWDCILGFTNNYKWRGTTYNTYQAATPWINSLTGVAIADWNDIDAAEQLFADMLEPNTNEPVMIEPDTIIHMPAKKHLFRQIFGATQIETQTDSGATIRRGGNTLDQYRLVSSKAAYRRLIANSVSASNAKEYWLLGKFDEAFEWQYNWPLQVVAAPDNHEAEFKQDIQLRYKASERGSVWVKNPRYVVRVKNS